MDLFQLLCPSLLVRFSNVLYYMISQASPISQYLAHRQEIDEALHRVLLKGRYILGGGSGRL